MSDYEPIVFKVKRLEKENNQLKATIAEQKKEIDVIRDGAIETDRGFLLSDQAVKVLFNGIEALNNKGVVMAKQNNIIEGVSINDGKYQSDTFIKELLARIEKLEKQIAELTKNTGD